jgi:histidine triad (HIT) family protein
VVSEPAGVAFLDTRPVFPGHVLVVPRTHMSTLLDLPPSALAGYFGLVQRVTGAVQSGLDADGSFVAINNVVSQSVPHLHTHVVPRRRKDGLRGFFWPRGRYASDDEAAGYAARIAAALPSAVTGS